MCRVEMCLEGLFSSGFKPSTLNTYRAMWGFSLFGLRTRGAAPLGKLLHGCSKGKLGVLGGVQGHLLKGGEQDGLAHLRLSRAHGGLQLHHVLLHRSADSMTGKL